MARNIHMLFDAFRIGDLTIPGFGEQVDQLLEDDPMAIDRGIGTDQTVEDLGFSSVNALNCLISRGADHPPYVTPPGTRRRAFTPRGNLAWLMSGSEQANRRLNQILRKHPRRAAS